MIRCLSDSQINYLKSILSEITFLDSADLANQLRIGLFDIRCQLFSLIRLADFLKCLYDSDCIPAERIIDSELLNDQN